MPKKFTPTPIETPEEHRARIMADLKARAARVVENGLKGVQPSPKPRD